MPCAQRWLDCTLEEVHAGCVRSEPRLARARDDPGPVPLDLVMRVPPGAAAGLRFAFPGQVRHSGAPVKACRVGMIAVCSPRSLLRRERHPTLPWQRELACAGKAAIARNMLFCAHDRQ